MPIPFLLAALGVAAVGAGIHLNAKDTNKRAERRAEDAQALYDNAKSSLEIAQNNTEKSLVKLGYAKKEVLDTSMKKFLITYEKIKHIQFKESVGIHEISQFSIDQQGALAIKELTNIYSSSFSSGTAGVAAGTAVALAVNGSLPIVTGGLATAGSALAAGEIGAATGIAGSALSFGAAMTPLAAIAAPVALFTGIAADIKADENLEKANAMHAKARRAAEKMKTAETLCGAITQRADMFDNLLIDLNRMFIECNVLLDEVVKRKSSGFLFFKKKIKAKNLSENDLRLIAVTRALAGAIKAVIDTPILSKDGNISQKSATVCEQARLDLPKLTNEVQIVKTLNYSIKPKAGEVADLVTEVKTIPQDTPVHNTKTTIARGIRTVLAIVLGILIATAFAEIIATNLTNPTDKFLFVSALTANTIAFWIIICSYVTMLIGQFSTGKIKKLCTQISCIALSILYVQYCRTIIQMDHYILFSIGFFIIALILATFFSETKWKISTFFFHQFLVMIVWPLGFILYALFNEWLEFNNSVCLIVTSILICIMTFGLMDETIKDKIK